MAEENLNKKVFSGLIWKFGERFTAELVTFVVSIVLARLLMPDDYGVIALMMVFITIANVFVINGFGNALIQKSDTAWPRRVPDRCAFRPSSTTSRSSAPIRA